MEKVKKRGLYIGSGVAAVAWGAIVAVKGFLDSFWLNPESEFITQHQWLKHAGFEILYGTACVVAGFLLFAYSRRVPEFVVRPAQPPEEL